MAKASAEPTVSEFQDQQIFKTRDCEREKFFEQIDKMKQ